MSIPPKPQRKKTAQKPGEFSFLFQNNPLPMWIQDLKTMRFLEVNQAAVKLYGYSRAEFLRMRLLDIYPKTEAVRQRTHRDAKRGWAEYMGERTHLKKSGTPIHVIVTSRTLTYQGRKVALIVINDLTEHKRIQEALEQSEQSYRSLFKNIPDGIYRTTPEGKILAANPTLVSMLGYKSEADMLKINVQSLYLNPADRRRAMRKINQTDNLRNEEIQLKRRDGQVVSALENAHTVRDKTGKVLFYEGTITNISERKQTEERTQRHLTELQTLYESSLAFGHTMDVHAIGEQIVRVLKKHLYWQYAAVRLRRDDSDEMELITYSVGEHKPNPRIQKALASVSRVGQGLSGWAVEHGEMARVDELAKDVRHLETFPGMKSGLYVPIKLGEIAIGVISVESEKTAAFGESDERLLYTIATQAAAAIQNARMFNQTQRRSMEAERLYEISAELAKQSDISSLLKNITNEAALLLGVPGGTIYLYEAARAELEVVASTDLNLPIGSRLRMGEGLSGRVAQSREAMIVEDYRTWSGAVPQYKNQLFYSVLAVPMLYGGELMGVLVAHGLHATVSSKENNRKFTERDMRLLALFASSTAGAVYNTRLLESERKRRQEAETLQRTASALTSSLNVEQILDSLLDGLGQVIPFNSAVVFIKEGNQLRPASEKGLRRPNNVMGRFFPVDNALMQSALESRRPLILPDAHKDDRFKDWEHSHATRGWMGVPLIVRDEAIGCLTIDSYQVNAFNDVQGEMAMAFANQAATAIENARLFQNAVRYAQRWTTLHAVSQEIARVGEDLEQVCASIHHAARKLVPAEAFTIVLLDEKQAQLEGVYLFDRSGRSPKMRYPFGRGFSSRVIASGFSLKVDDDLETKIDGVAFGAPVMTRSILAVPLRVTDKVIGAMSVQSYQPNAYSSEDQLLLELLATQAAIAIENTRLFEETRRRVREFEMLYETTREIALHQQDLSSLMQILADRAVRLLGAAGSGIYLYDSENQNLTVAFRSGDEQELGQRIKIGEGINGQVAQMQSPLVIDDYQTWEHRTPSASKFPYRAVVSVPLLYSGELIGTLDVFEYGESDRKFSEDDVQLLSLFSAHAASAIHNARLFDQTHRNAEEFKALYETTRDIALQQDKDSLLKMIVLRAADLLHSKNGGLYLYDDERKELELSIFTEMNIKKGTRLKLGEGGAGHVALTHEPLIIDDYQAWEGHAMQYTGVPFRAVLQVPMLYGGELIGVLTVNEYGDSERTFTQEDASLLSLFASHAAGIVHSARLLDQLEARVEQFATLHSIDMAISSTTDLHVTTQLVLESVVRLLKIDAAGMLIHNPITFNLEYAGGVGFHSEVNRTTVRLEEGLARTVALTHQTLDVPDLSKAKLPQHFRKIVESEGFLSYRCLPLMAKGEVKGVLELFNRSTLPSNPEWNNLLNMLAGQAAIAIDNSLLFNNLERANIELELAYDATIEGWSQALELRDYETSGHTKRMLDTTLTLAKKMGIPDQEFPNIRRGVLLHDIGKMAVPDQILLKDNLLSEEEWQIMHQHPLNAYNMLSKISYLGSAIDIPYCHHEKWDGTGYPRGLRGEQIPLSARIFSIVDVYDALAFDRPYRPAWPKEKVMTYIKEQSGIHFDPRVVEAFLRMLS